MIKKFNVMLLAVCLTALVPCSVGAEQRNYDTARAGNVVAIEKALDDLFWYAAPSQADPATALAILREGLAAGAERSAFYKLDELEATLERCAQVSPFDALEFMNEHFLKADAKLWELAEEASNTDRFGSPNSRLALQLICHSWPFSPASRKSAIAYVYGAMTQGLSPAAFNICEHVSGRLGASYCSQRRTEAREIEAKEIERTTQSMPVSSPSWSIRGVKVPARCMATEWQSSDNFKAYSNQFDLPDAFWSQPGRFFGKEVPLTPIVEWDIEIALAYRLSHCKAIVGDTSDDEDTKSEPEGSYKVLRRWGERECERVLPQFVGGCYSLVYVEVWDGDPYNLWSSYNSYAHVSSDGDEYIILVTNGMKLTDLESLVQLGMVSSD